MYQPITVFGRRPTTSPAGPLAITIVAALLGPGCTDGTLVQPSAHHPALMLQARLAQPAPAGATQVVLVLDAVPYCPWSDIPDPFAPRPAPIDFHLILPPAEAFDPAATTLALPAYNISQPANFLCRSQNVPLVRFFQPTLNLSPQDIGGPPPAWISHDTIIAYADEPVSFTLFGPDDQQIVLPAGYSLLRRVCGALDQPWQLGVAAPDEPVDFYPPDVSPNPAVPLALGPRLEQRERSLLAGCGLASPPLDQGVRVGFDRGVSLAFSPDGQTLFYVMPIDPSDPAQAAPLRSIDLTTGVTRERAIIPGAKGVQVSGSNDIYVSTSTTFHALAPRLDGSEQPTQLPISPPCLVSPDGKWISYVDWTSARETGPVEMVWDVAAGQPHVVQQGYGVSWTPASLLVDGLAVFAPSDGHLVTQFTSLTANTGQLEGMFWGAEGPALLTAPIHWTPQQPASRPILASEAGDPDKDFGLTVEELATHTVSNVLDARAGIVTLADVATDGSGVALVWTRRCLGLFETVCSFSLHELSLPAQPGSPVHDQVVAVSDSAAPVAISTSGHRFAIAARDGIYVRDLR